MNVLLLGFDCDNFAQSHTVTNLKYTLPWFWHTHAKFQVIAGLCIYALTLNYVKLGQIWLKIGQKLPLHDPKK